MSGFLKKDSAGTALVERVETLLVDVPTIRPHKLSVATMQGQTMMLVRLYCSDGSVGMGEGTTIAGLAYGPESPEGMKSAIDTYFTPLLLGSSADHVQSAMALIGKCVNGNRFAKCAVETALLDAWARRLGIPLSSLLGGRVREDLPVAWTLASGDTARDIAEAEQRLQIEDWRPRGGGGRGACRRRQAGPRQPRARHRGCQHGLERARGKARLIGTRRCRL